MTFSSLQPPPVAPTLLLCGRVVASYAAHREPRRNGTESCAESILLGTIDGATSQGAPVGRRSHPPTIQSPTPPAACRL